MICEYNGGLTREQFLFYEIRIVASLQLQGLSREEIVEEIKHANLFQFPTERMISSIAKRWYIILQTRLRKLQSRSICMP